MNVSRKTSTLSRLSRAARLSYALLSAPLALQPVLAATATSPPQATATLASVTQVSAGRYQISGTALDSAGNPACALALASGQCVFTCGPGSSRCDGATADMPFGQFQLTNLLADPNGTITLQIFVQGHVSYAEVIPVPAAH